MYTPYLYWLKKKVSNIYRGVSFTDTTARTATHLTPPKPILIGVGAGACNRKTAL